MTGLADRARVFVVACRDRRWSYAYVAGTRVATAVLVWPIDVAASILLAVVWPPLRAVHGLIRGFCVGAVESFNEVRQPMDVFRDLAFRALTAGMSKRWSEERKQEMWRYSDRVLGREVTFRRRPVPAPMVDLQTLPETPETGTTAGEADDLQGGSR